MEREPTEKELSWQRFRVQKRAATGAATKLFLTILQYDDHLELRSLPRDAQPTLTSEGKMDFYYKSSFFHLFAQAFVITTVVVTSFQ